MFLNILYVTILPVAIGFAVNHFYGGNENFEETKKTMPLFSVLGLACIVGGVISAVHPHIINGGMELLLLTLEGDASQQSTRGANLFFGIILD